MIDEAVSTTKSRFKTKTNYLVWNVLAVEYCFILQTFTVKLGTIASAVVDVADDVYVEWRRTTWQLRRWCRGLLLRSSCSQWCRDRHTHTRRELPQYHEMTRYRKPACSVGSHWRRILYALTTRAPHGHVCICTCRRLALAAGRRSIGIVLPLSISLATSRGFLFSFFLTCDLPSFMADKWRVLDLRLHLPVEYIPWWIEYLVITTIIIIHFFLRSSVSNPP